MLAQACSPISVLGRTSSMTRRRISSAASCGPTAGSAFTSVPVIDIAELRGGNRARVVGELLDAAHSVGFFYVSRHGLESACDAALEASRQFFALTYATKTALENVHSPAFRGYVRTGAENTNGVADWREQLELGHDEPAPAAPALPPFRRLRGPNLLPSEAECPGFRLRMDAVMSGMGALTAELLEAMEEGLCLPQGRLRGAFAGDAEEGMPGSFCMKVCRYPPVPGGSEAEAAGVLGVGEHSDSGVLTLLLQQPGTSGLQARNSEGLWVDVPPLPGTLVVNIGELLQLATGGYFVATVHRVLAQRGAAARISIPYFNNGAPSCRVQPLELPAGLPWRRGSPPLRSAEASGTHSGRNTVLGCAGANVFKSYARSHPVAFARNHPDLEIAPNGDIVVRQEQEAAAER